MKRKIAIFGAGEWGRIAYYYYRESGEIACYIDNDASIWNTTVNGLQVCAPEILKEHKYTVIVANKRYEDEIKRQLLQDYDIREVVLFRIDERMQELSGQKESRFEKEELIVAFSHGLGNQMFQYAFTEICCKGKKCESGSVCLYQAGHDVFRVVYGISGNTAGTV